MSYRSIRLEQHDGVAEVVLDNPGQLNAMDRAFFHEIRDVFTALGADDTVRCIVLWAEGRVFSAGLNLKEGAHLLPPPSPGISAAQRNMQLRQTILDFQACFTAVRKCPKPVIAAIHGMCIGGGLDLVTACDIRLCDQDALFSIHEVKMAMVADLGTLQRIGRIVGRGIARELAFSGRLLAAQRALACGLVNEVFADKPALLAGARVLATEIALNSPLVVQGIKQVLDYCDEHSEDEGLEYVAQWNTAFFVSHDLEEAVAAFASKRQPTFKGT